MLLSFTKATKSLSSLLKFHCSYFENFSEKINPAPNADLSYTNPKYRRSEATRRYVVPLNKKTQQFVDETKYRLFKEKMIGVKPPLELSMPDDPLWGEQEPKHYIQSRSSTELFKIRPYDGVEQPKALSQELRFKPQIVESLNLDNLSTCNPFNIAQFLLKQRLEGTYESNLQLFTLAEKILSPKLHDIALIDLVRLRHAFLGPSKFGSSKFLNNLKKIIHQEYKSLNAEGLLAAFVTERFERNVDIQEEIMELLLKQKNLKHFTSSPEKLLDFIECFAQYKIPEFKKNRNLRILSEAKITNINFLAKLPLQDSVTFMTNQQKIKLMKALFRMKAQGFKHILYKIGTTTNEQQLTPQQAIEYTDLLSKLESGEGYINTSQLDTMKQIFLANWDKYNNFERVKIVHIFWNLNHSWEEFQGLYEEIPVEADINMLYYFAQIQLTDSSNREHQVLRALMEVDLIPAPYFQKIKQFIIYTGSFGWNLNPLLDKMYETELLINADRLIDNLIRDKDVINLGKFLTIVPIKLQKFVPIENNTIIPYAYEELLIGVETIPNKDIAPNGTLKKTALGRTKMLESLGWEMIQVRWGEFIKQSISQQHKFLYKRLAELWESQQVRKEERQYAESLEVLKLAKARDFEFLHFDDIDEFSEGMRPTQQEVNAVVLGLELPEGQSQTVEQIEEEK